MEIVALSTSCICMSLQAPVITRQSVRYGNCTCERQQLVSMLQQRGFTTADRSCTSTWRTGGTLPGVAESLRWRSRKTWNWTCIHDAQGSSSPAEERGRHATAAGAATNSASTTATPSSIDDVSVDKSAPATIGRMELDDLKLVRKVRWALFYATTFVLAGFFLSVSMIIHPWVLTFDKQRRVFHHIIVKTWAIVPTKFFYETEIVDLESLPADSGAVVYVANHQSFLDVYLPYHIGRQFRYVSKTENFQIPFIGGLMQINNYIPLDRTYPKDQLLRLKTCMKSVREGISVVLFPEGTRAKDGALADFKLYESHYLKQ